MAYKRYVVEFGMGADLHGGNLTKAAQKAVKDALSHCCLCGLQDILGLENPDAAMKVHVKIGCTAPEKVDKAEVMTMVPIGEAEIEVVQGGIHEKGLHVDRFGEGNLIEIVNAVLTVWVDVP